MSLPKSRVWSGRRVLAVCGGKIVNCRDIDNPMVVGQEIGVRGNSRDRIRRGRDRGKTQDWVHSNLHVKSKLLC